MEETYTYKQVMDYVRGWFISDADFNNLSMNEIKAALNNALVTLECGDDGLPYFVKRNKN
jgi:hypothetical protein